MAFGKLAARPQIDYFIPAVIITDATNALCNLFFKQNRIVEQNKFAAQSAAEVGNLLGYQVPDLKWMWNDFLIDFIYANWRSDR